MAKKVKIKSKKPQGIGSKIFDVVNYLLLAILGFIMFYPMFYVFIVSISSSQYINQGLVTLFPRGINFDAYKAVFENQRIWSGYKNTFLYTGLGTLICLVLTAMCAYPLSRKDFYGRKVFTVLIMITMFVNGGMIPTYLVINKRLNEKESIPKTNSLIGSNSNERISVDRMWFRCFRQQ